MASMAHFVTPQACRDKVGVIPQKRDSSEPLAWEEKECGRSAGWMGRQYNLQRMAGAHDRDGGVLGQ